jgi:hypothetical protein
MGKAKSNKNQLRVCRVVDVPLREVSGICLRRSRNGQMFLIAVGDRVAKIAWFSHEDRLVFSAAERWGPNRLAYEEHCEALRFDASQV